MSNFIKKFWSRKKKQIVVNLVITSRKLNIKGSHSLQSGIFIKTIKM